MLPLQPFEIMILAGLAFFVFLGLSSIRAAAKK